MALLDDLLLAIDDNRLSRSERRALGDVIAEAHLDDDDRALLISGLFQAVEERMVDARDKALLGSLQDAAKLLRPRQPASWPASRAWFGPADPMVETLEALVRATRARIDLAVFTLTDDRLCAALLDAHRRHVQVRILTDDDKAADRGSDVRRLEAAGVQLHTDASPYHFHHKFCVLDGNAVVTGSYNWTRGADRDNRENFLLSHEPPLVAAYQHAFDSLWAELG